MYVVSNIVASRHGWHSMSVLTTPLMLNLCFRKIYTISTHVKPMVISKNGLCIKSPMVLTKCLKIKECIGIWFKMKKRDSKNEGMYWKLFQNEGMYWKFFQN